MSVHKLPPRPSLERLRNEAKDLHRGLRTDDAEARAALAEHHPRPPAPAVARLADAQLVIARRYGLRSWPALVQAVEAIGARTRAPYRVEAGATATLHDRADELVRLACLTYGADSRQRVAEAEALLAREPGLAVATIFAAAACGDAEAVARFVRDDGNSATREGGPHAWAPLLCACYARLGRRPGRSALAVVRILLDHGADPNTGYLWDGHYPPFTALTGVFGGGEGGASQPAHPEALELARLLLERGADPNDGQTLYNRHFTPANDHLELLFSYGLGQGDGGPWRRLLGGESPATMLEDQLLFAVANGFTERVALLLAHGVDPLGRGTSHPALGGLGAVEIAAADRHLEIVELLVGAGAPRPVFDPVDQLLGALLAGDRGATETLLATRPTLVREALRRVPARIVRAAELGRPEAVTLLADVGFDVNARERTTALHEAAWRGDRVLVELLLSLGADATIRDREHHGTPAGWAHHNGHAELAAYLAEIEQQS